MPHTAIFAFDYNNYIRQMRSFLKDAPRVVRSGGYEDINNLGVSYKVSGGASDRAAGDILHVAAETTALLKTYRATAVKTGTACSFGTPVTPTVTFNTGARTIVRSAGNWATDGFAANDCIRLDNCATAGNNGVWRISTITTTTITNDTITLDTLDALAASDAADVITATRMTGGAILDVRADSAGANTHIGWLCGGLEFVAKNGTLHLMLTSGSSWAVGDYAEWVFERGSFSLFEDKAVSRKVTFVDGGGGSDTITRKDYGGSFIKDGFINGGIIEVLGSASNNGRFLITAAVTAKTITLATGTVTAEAGVVCTLIPRLRNTVNFDDADATFGGSPPTIIRSAGSWVTDGYVAGGLIEVQDAATGGNNGFWLIEAILTDAIANDTLKLATGQPAITDGSTDVITHTPRNTILQKWTEHRYRWDMTSGVTGISTQDLTAGKLPPVWDSNGNYTSEWIGIGPGNDSVNNLQTIYCGWQSQFSGTTLQNIELRACDGVSDSSFGSLLNVSPPTYIYLSKTPAMEVYTSADGEHATGFCYVAAATADWFYIGYLDLHSSQSQHPRPIFVGGMGPNSANTKSTSGNQMSMFTKAQAWSSSAVSPEIHPAKSGAWFRWVDGTWYAVYLDQRYANGTTDALSAAYMSLWVWPFSPISLGSYTYVRPGTGTNYQVQLGTNSSYLSWEWKKFLTYLKPTPTSVTANPNREYALLPCTLVMADPNLNVIGDLRGIFAVSDDGQATKNRIVRGREIYIVGQNHEKTTAENFMALHLN